MSKAKTKAPKLAPASPPLPRDITIPDVEPDDEVAIKPWCFEPDGARMTPIVLYKDGWPNRFRVLDVQDYKGQRCLKLDPCCNWMEDHQNGNFRCEWHPAMCFSKIEPVEPKAEVAESEEEARVPKPEDRYTSVDTPWGEVLKVEFLDDDKVPVIKLRFANGRRPFSVSGEVARFMKERATELGFL